MEVDMAKKNTTMIERDVLEALVLEREQAINGLEMAVEIIKRQHELLKQAGVDFETGKLMVA
jgi:hypothetical protein